MSREQFIKHRIKERGSTIKEFARDIGMPYSTLLSMLNGSLGGAAIENVARICQGLGITVADLQNSQDDSEDALALTDLERQLIEQYRQHPELHAAIHKILDLPMP